MTLADHLLSGALAYCFAAAGGLVAGGVPAGLADWNRRFLAGMSMAAALLFPLSLAAPGAALKIEAGALAAVGLLYLPRAFSAVRQLRSSAPWRTRLRPRDGVSAALTVLIAGLAAQFAVRNARLGFEWDGFQIWATKARLLHFHGALNQDWLLPGVPERVVEYPPLVPLYEALLWLFRGSLEWDGVKPVFGFFFVSMIVSTFEAASGLVSRRWALAAAAMLAALPGVSSGTNLGGYADMPLAAFAAGTMAVLLGPARERSVSFRGLTPWILGGLLWVKNEGAILLLIAAGAVAFVWVRSGWREARRSFGLGWRALPFLGVFAGIRWSHVRWVDSRSVEFAPLDWDHIRRAAGVVWDVPRYCAPHLLNLGEWGLFWPGFLLAAILLLLRGSRNERVLAAAAAACVGAYAAVFCFTNWDVRLHVDNAFQRLLIHAAPGAAIVIAAAAGRAWKEAGRGPAAR